MSNAEGIGKGDLLYELKEVSFSYPGQGRDALKKINLSFLQGERVVFVGPCGAGKSTLLEILASLLLPKTGQICFRGRKITRKGEICGRIGMTFQFPEKHFFETTVFDEVTLSLRERGKTKKEQEQIYSEVMELVGLDPVSLRNKTPFQLSLGEKRRVALASILSFNPQVLLLDEPLAGLDREGKRTLIEFLRKAEDKTVFLVTQDFSVIESFGERIVFLKEGRVIFDGSLEETLDFPWREEDISFLPPLYQLTLRSKLPFDEVKKLMGKKSC